MKEYFEANPSVVKKLERRKNLSCSFCPPNKMENAKRGSTYQCKSWKHKTKRKKQFKLNSTHSG